MRVTVLLGDEEAKVFNAYCTKHGFKKSTLIGRLIRDHIEQSGFQLQKEMFVQEKEGSSK